MDVEHFGQADILKYCSKKPLEKLIRESASSESIRTRFPATRYYGSKLRLVDWISNTLEGVNYQSVLDVFGGTATVSLLFKSKGKSVTYNDALLSNNYVANAVLSGFHGGIRTNLIEDVIAGIQPRKGFISNTFQNYYFEDHENNWLDGAIDKISLLNDEQLKSDVLYCVFQACLQKRPFNLFHRKNLYIRQNCAKDTSFGNWRTWERDFDELIRKAAIQLEKAKRITSGSANVLPPGDASDVNGRYDLVYIDPPYVKQRKNDLTYTDRYHFLEGLADPRAWQDRIDYTRKNLGFSGIQSIDEWNRKETFKQRLFEFIQVHKKSVVVLSYASNGYPTLDELLKYFKDNFNNVAIFRRNLSHALKSKAQQEVLIIGV